MQEKFSGIVIHGLGKGREFGFPTANIRLDDSALYVEKGIYAVSVTVDNQLLKGMLYVGTRPTLDLQEVSIEIHLLEFDENIYNKQIFFQILQKIRNEIHFCNIENLITQLHHDREMVYNFFSKS